ncbi:MAG: DNA cytosine methyltransferase [Proteobacteria bacterium]|nr:DNA cytosine methyltransferase [Pseudomonadota bacterium]
MSRAAALQVYEFFAGGGMARKGLEQASGARFACAFANDFDPVKARTYRANFEAERLREGDVWALGPGDLPGRADLAWASSPCQDLSLAGGRAGLKGGRSSAFWGFWRLMQALDVEGRAPRAIVIENVTGLLTSAGGADFIALCEALAGLGYRFGAVEADAELWLPQSRPRLFVVATREPPSGSLAAPREPFHSRAVREAFERLPETLKVGWVWWALATPLRRNRDLASILEPDATAAWFDEAKTDHLLSLMGPGHRLRLETALASGERRVGALYRRVRVEQGQRVQRAEVRFDGLAGCLRTPAGGSSRQIVVVAEAGRVRARQLSAREAARLMGLPDDYRLPQASTAALKVCGDGVAVPVVRAIAEGVLAPLLAAQAVEAA